jgi:Carboxypeptidase regulatory-like domain
VIRMTRQGLSASVVALAVGLGAFGVARAQDAPSDAGLIIGEVARCVNGAEQASAGVSVGVDGGSGSLTRTDSGGQFFLSLPPGQYTVVASSADGTASRQYVPVEAGQALDIGILDLGAGIAGCGPEADVTAPVQPTVTPAPTQVPVVPTATVVPTVQATPVPATPTPAADTDPGADPTPEA